MPAVEILHVFCHPSGGGGNPLGVVLDGNSPAPERRQPLAAELGFSETVYLLDAARGELRIHTPTVELPFAGHPLVGTAWLLAREGAEPSVLHPPAGEVAVRVEGREAFVSGRPEWAPPFEWRELPTAAAVEELEPPTAGATGAWAWLDEPAGVVRARVFPVAYGIAEDEATGAAALLLCAALGRPLDIRQGRRSRILARPLEDGLVEIGGSVEYHETRLL